jgi:hypothetical protein
VGKGPSGNQIVGQDSCLRVTGPPLDVSSQPRGSGVSGSGGQVITNGSHQETASPVAVSWRRRGRRLPFIFLYFPSGHLALLLGVFATLSVWVQVSADVHVCVHHARLLHSLAGGSPGLP